MKATGIVRGIVELGREPLDTSLTLEEKFAIAVHSFVERHKESRTTSCSVEVVRLVKD